MSARMRVFLVAAAAENVFAAFAAIGDEIGVNRPSRATRGHTEGSNDGDALHWKSPDPRLQYTTATEACEKKVARGISLTLLQIPRAN